MGAHVLFMGKRTAQAFWGQCGNTDQYVHYVPTSDLIIPVPGINPKAIIPNVCIYLRSTLSDCNDIYNSK